MELNTILQPSVWHVDPLRFCWNSETGELSGADAAAVRALVDQAVQEGQTPIHPAPAAYPVADPLHRLDEMAAVLGYHWHLPPSLAAYYPRLPVDNGSSTIGLRY